MSTCRSAHRKTAQRRRRSHESSPAVSRANADWLQNDPTRQTVAPYSLRGLAVPTVATPVTWEEVEQAVEAGDADRLTFLPGDVLERVERLGDLFPPVRGLRQQLPKPANT
jgi:bifunctional non-homologous end joining protein LigD